MEILIKAIDSRMPTVEEWREQLNEITLPAAQALFAAYPDAEQAKATKARIESYNSAVALLQSVQAGKQVEPEKQTKAALTISAYSANPVTQQQVNRAKLLHWPTSLDDGSILSMVDKLPEHVGPSVAEQYDYYRNQTDIEQYKSDKAKSDELAVLDIQGCSKLGDIIDIRPDGFCWGKAECPPIFIRIKVPGGSEKSYQYLREPVLGSPDSTGLLPIFDTKHRWSIDISKINDSDEFKLEDFLNLVLDKSKV